MFLIYNIFENMKREVDRQMNCLHLGLIVSLKTLKPLKMRADKTAAPIDRLVERD